MHLNRRFLDQLIETTSAPVVPIVQPTASSAHANVDVFFQPSDSPTQPPATAAISGGSPSLPHPSQPAKPTHGTNLEVQQSGGSNATIIAASVGGGVALIALIIGSVFAYRSWNNHRRAKERKQRVALINRNSNVRHLNGSFDYSTLSSLSRHSSDN